MRKVDSKLVQKPRQALKCKRNANSNQTMSRQGLGRWRVEGVGRRALALLARASAERRSAP